MPYFPKAEELQYLCPNCRRYFYPGHMSCCVMHEPGTCCHEYEQPAPGPMSTPAAPRCPGG